MTQGTRSVLFGCHSVIHSILVSISWVIVHKKIPKLWQVVCIFLHDVGHVGTNYLDNYEEKRMHWKLGADIAFRLFGKPGYLMVAGHCQYSNFVHSELYYADKYSWYIAPYWWLYWNSLVEPELNCGQSIHDAINNFKATVKQSIESSSYVQTHDMFLARKNKQTKGA